MRTLCHCVRVGRCLVTDSAVGFAAGRSTPCSARGQDDGDDETIQSEGFSEDHHKNEGDQDISLSVTTNTGITDDTNAKAGGEGGETTAESSTESLVSLVVSIGPFAWVSEVCWSVLDLGDALLEENRNNEAVHTEHTSHNDGNDRFEEKVGLEDGDGDDTNTGLGSSVGRAEVSENEGSNAAH